MGDKGDRKWERREYKLGEKGVKNWDRSGAGNGRTGRKKTGRQGGQEKGEKEVETGREVGLNRTLMSLLSVVILPDYICMYIFIHSWATQCLTVCLSCFVKVEKEVSCLFFSLFLCWCGLICQLQQDEISRSGCWLNKIVKQEEPIGH